MKTKTRTKPRPQPIPAIPATAATAASATPAAATAADPETRYDPDHACDLMREVCILANTAIRVSRHRPNLIHDEDDDDREDRIQLLRQTLNRIGWVADVAQRSLGGTGSFSSAEDWMLAGS